MIKVAIIDDYQNVSEHFINSTKSENKYEITVFNEPFISEDEAIETLKSFDALKSTYISLNNLGFDELNIYKEYGKN